MQNDLTQKARDCLSDYGDQGFAVVAETILGEIYVVESNFDPAFDEQVIKDAVEAGDPVLGWISRSLGIAPMVSIATAEDSGLVARISANTCTVISTIVEGAHLGIIVAHTATAIEEFEAAELISSAIALHSQKQIPRNEDITDKETVYLERATTGATDDEIAEELHLSLRAVKERKRKAIEDLGAKNIAHAITIAKKTSLI